MAGKKKRFGRSETQKSVEILGIWRVWSAAYQQNIFGERAVDVIDY